MKKHPKPTCQIKLNKLIILLFVLVVSVGKAMPPDSLRTKWVNGQKYILHKVAPKETYLGVCRRYKVSLKDIQAANPGVTVLKIGQIIQVPLSNTTEETVAPVETASPKQVVAQAKEKMKVKYHTVKRGETLYRISKEYNLSVDDIKDLNNLKSNNVAVGQKLIVGKTAVAQGNSSTKANEEVPALREVIVDPAPTKPEAVKENKEVKAETKAEPKPVVREEKKTEQIQKSELPQKAEQSAKVDTPSVFATPGNSRSSVVEKDPKSGTTVEKVTETGIATWITDGELNQNKFYALHRSAPVGTIVKVTNRMNNNSVFVKVVGLLPDTGDNSGIIIKITQAAAQRIGALDQRFQAEMTYGITK